MRTKQYSAKPDSQNEHARRDEYNRECFPEALASLWRTEDIWNLEILDQNSIGYSFFCKKDYLFTIEPLVSITAVMGEFRFGNVETVWVHVRVKHEHIQAVSALTVHAIFMTKASLEELDDYRVPK